MHHITRSLTLATQHHQQSLPALHTMSPMIPTSNTPHSLMEYVKQLIVELIVDSSKLVYNVPDIKLNIKMIQRVTQVELGDLTLPLYSIAKLLDKSNKPDHIAATLYDSGVSVLLNDDKYKHVISRADVKGAYINFFIQVSYLCNIIQPIIDHKYLCQQTHDNQMRVMIEYSQPNTYVNITVLYCMLICTMIWLYS